MKTKKNNKKQKEGLIASIRKNRKLKAHRKQLWKNIMEIHHMFD